MRYSLSSLRSGLKCYIAFMSKQRCPLSGVRVCIAQRNADTCYPGAASYFPPQGEALLAWSTLFRCGKTLRNYMGYVKTGCMLVGTSTEVSAAQSTAPS